MADKIDVTTQPFDGYDTMTTGQLLTRLVNLDEDARTRTLAYERKHQKRKQLIWLLVNWNSILIAAVALPMFLLSAGAPRGYGG